MRTVFHSNNVYVFKNNNFFYMRFCKYISSVNKQLSKRVPVASPTEQKLLHSTIQFNTEAWRLVAEVGRIVLKNETQKQ